MSNPTLYYLLLFVVILCLLDGAWAFGAGDIPDFAYLNDKAFRHGDIENILAELLKAVASGGGGFNISEALQGGGGGLLGLAGNVLKTAAKTASGGSKFSKDDVKKVYFGNWLRDYSQAMDIAGLSKLSADNLIMIVAILGFLEFGFATDEFRVTPERLGVYLPVEHIDNPKGYAEKEGDARQFHPKLRPPVDQRELEIDQRNGMKNYMATEDGGWDTSTAYIRRSFRSSIEHGRRARGQEGDDLWESYRTLGQGLHTLEDLLAHSNWCELALRKMGHQDVFPHVGDEVRVRAPNGEEVPPLVTGTFGSADFLHSLLGEGMDKLSQTSMTDVTAAMQDSKNSDKDNKLSALKDVLGNVMKLGGNQDSANDKMNKADDLKAQSEAYNFDPNNVMPPEVQKQLWDLLEWRDDVYRDFIRQLAMVPGLSELIDNLTDALNAYVYTLLAPYLTPMLGTFSSVLGEGSSAVIESDDQYAVFDDARASDPSHSLISKDHFALILNEPAGKIARVVVAHTVNAITRAWAGEGEPDRVIDGILEAFHHPYWATGQSQVQKAMFTELEKWIGGLGSEDAQRAIEGLTKESVRAHKNKRLSEDQEREANSSYKMGGHACGQAHGGASGARPQQTGGYGASGGRPQQQQAASGYGRQQESRQQESGGYAAPQTGGYARQEESTGYGRQQESGGYGRQEETGYGRQQESGGYNSQQSGGYGRQQESGREQESTGYGRQQESGGYGASAGYGETRAQETFGGSRREEEPSYGSRRTEESTTYGSGGGRRQQEESGGYGGRDESSGYGGRSQESGGYGGRTEESAGYGGRTEQSAGYGGRTEESAGYGGRTQESAGYGGSTEESTGYGGRTEQSSYGSGGGGYGGRAEETSYSTGGARREEGGGGYGRSEETSYGGGGGGGYGGGRSEAGYGGDSTEQSSYGGGGGGYGGSRREEGGGYGGGETFGAERLSVRDDDDNEGERHRKKKHHNQRDD